MVKLTQDKIIRKLLESSDGWVPSWRIIKANTEWGWLGTSADRCARRMVEKGEIFRKQDGKYAYYRIKPVEYRTVYVKSPTGEVEQTIRLPL